MEQQNNGTRRKKLVLLLFAAVFAICATVWLVIQLKPEPSPLDDPDVGFQMYMPYRLPEGFHVTGKRISAHNASFHSGESGDPNKLKQVTLDMNLREEDWVYSITQRRAEPKHMEQIATAHANADYSPTSVKPSCMNGTSAAGKQYRLCHWIDYGRINVFEVKFIEGNTFIDTTFPATLQRSLDISEIDAYVDSFEESQPTDIPIMLNAV